MLLLFIPPKPILVWLMRRFPYSVIYDVTTSEIRVLALAHQRRRVTNWRLRK